MMPVPFVDLAQSCAPMIASETLAGIISLESGFAPLNIRINSGPPLKEQPASKAEAIEMATTLAADHQDIQLGLGGISIDELKKLKLSVSDAFDPCANLQATATLLEGYYRFAIRIGDDKANSVTDAVAENSNEERASDEASPLWDVFSSRRRSSILVFSNKHGAE